jgi:hypothetical protein
VGTNSGAKSILYNTRERLISTDPNRAQAFASQAAAEVLRYLLDASNEGDVSGGGLEQLHTGVEAFPAATILSGIRGRPEVGTVNLFVEPGAMLVVDNPTPGADDSIASLLTDAGVQTAGVLVLTTGSGSTRIDVLECRRIANVVETDNRDIFNPATGLFAPASVTKVQNSVLTYRLRVGTPGAGFPGTAAGWLPLMVASVPSSATSWDAVTCWDVRPLAQDRANGPFATRLQIQENRRSFCYCDATSTPSQPRMSAEVQLTFDGCRAGGMIGDGFAAGSTSFFNPADVRNQEAGFSFGSAGALWHVYLVFPFGLPRWVRYADAGTTSPNQRVPYGPRGIPVVSSKVAAFSGKPLLTGVQTPTTTGLADPATFNAVLAYCGRGPKSPGTDPIGMHCDGRLWTFVNPDAFPLAPTTATTTLIRWNLPGGGSVPLVPGSARAVLLRFHAEFQFPAPALGAQGVGQIDAIVTVSNLLGNNASQGACPQGETQVVVDGNWVAPPTPGVNFVREFTVRVPLQPDLSHSNALPSFDANQTLARTFVVTWTHNVGIAPASNEMTVLGWELGP